jgi:ketosteroid isomerase-like protein
MNRINRHDVEALVEMMSPDHEFIDALGSRVRGSDALRAAWAGYFSWFPDYQIVGEKFFVDRDMVAVFGTASGTFEVNRKLHTDNHWRIPAAWMAVVRDGLIAQWRVYCDNEPVRRIMAAHATKK